MRVEDGEILLGFLKEAVKEYKRKVRLRKDLVRWI